MKYFIHGALLITLSFNLGLTLVHAQTTNPTGGSNFTNQTGGSDVTNPTGGGGVSLQNPIKATSIQKLFTDIIDILLVFAIPLVVFFIILAGFKYVTARGNESTISEAHMALLYALIGGVLILGAKVLIEVISGTVDAIAR